MSTKRALRALVCVVALNGLGAQITKSEYSARRDSLAARVKDGVVIAFGGRKPVTDFGPFFQLPTFHYLTGYDYADATLVMVVRDGKAASTLYYTKSTPRVSLYYGAEPDSVAIGRDMGLASEPAPMLGAAVEALASRAAPFYTLRDFEDADFAAADSLTRGGQFMKALQAKHPKLVVNDAHSMVAELRARKSPAEMALIRKAAEISTEGHKALMRGITPGMKEYEMRAIVEYTFGRLGGERPSYGSIVGAGPNGTQLHYMKDTREAKDGEVVVIDAATQYEGYAADITRTIPVSGTYTADQKAIYQVVRDAQAAAERNSKAGLSIKAAQDSSLDVRGRGLAALGLVESPEATLDMPWPTDCAKNPRSCQQVSLWSIHGISHGLGLAVHDPLQGNGGDGTFKVGDAFTIEPGVYVTTKLLDILPDTPKNRAFITRVRPLVERYRDTGVRIEDDYVVTENGTEWITRVPREIPEIEALLRQRRALPIP